MQSKIQLIVMHPSGLEVTKWLMGFKRERLVFSNATKSTNSCKNLSIIVTT